MKHQHYVEANRIAWNEAAPIHALRTFQKLLEGFKTPGYSSLHRPHEVECLRKLGLEGKTVIQLCCNNGRELLSIKNLFAAGECVGVDISEEFINQAKLLNQAAGLDVEFLCSSVDQIPDRFFGCFDLVYITVGALGWMPDVKVFFKLVSNLLKPDGQVFIYEMHPMLDMLDERERQQPLQACRSYFVTEPNVLAHGLDYVGNSTYESQVMFWFHHKLSDIISGMITHGVQITAFHEFGHDISNVFAHLEPLAVKPALSYILQGRKGGPVIGAAI